MNYITCERNYERGIMRLRCWYNAAADAAAVVALLFWTSAEANSNMGFWGVS